MAVVLRATTKPRPMHVLVVDPDVRERQALVRVLSAEADSAGPAAAELTVAGAGDCATALRYFASEHPDLLLVSADDIETFGREIARVVRASEGDRHTGIIFIDRRPKDDSTLSVECLEMGADDFLRYGCTEAELIARVRAVLRLKAMTDELRSANHRLRLLSLTDELTGLANMRSFDQRYGELLRACRDGQTAIGLMMIDLDHFKAVNDTSNHLVGSYVISEVGALLSELTGGSQFSGSGHGTLINAGADARRDGFTVPDGLAARFGGDEFIVAAVTPNLAALVAKAEDILAAVRARTFSHPDAEVRLTASIGVAWAAAGFRGPADDLIKAADLMLYRSKEGGRDRVSSMTMKYPLSLGPVESLRLARRGSGMGRAEFAQKAAADAGKALRQRRKS